MNCAFDGGAFDSVAFDVCIPAPSPSTFTIAGTVATFISATLEQLG